MRIGKIVTSLLNQLILTAQAVGFTISGGTSSKTLTVTDNATISGNNTGDNSGDQIASTVAFTPNGDIAASDVQSAIVEVRDDTDSKLSTKVPNTRTVNGHALSADVTVTKSDVGLGSVSDDLQLKAADLDTDNTLAANSDTKIASQKAVKYYVDNIPVANSIASSDSSVTVSSPTGSVNLSLNMSHTNNWSADQKFDTILGLSGILTLRGRLSGGGSGTINILGLNGGGGSGDITIQANNGGGGNGTLSLIGNVGGGGWGIVSVGSSTDMITFFGGSAIVKPSGNALAALAALNLITTPTLMKSDVGLGNVDNTSDADKPVSTATQTALNLKVDKTTTVNGHALSADVIVTKADVGLGSVSDDLQLKAADLDDDATLAANSSTKIPSQRAVKAYADQLISTANALVYKGVIDCSGNPNYPAANAGDLYVASVAGKIGGVSGVTVEIGDLILCNTDGTSSGNQATVGAYWNIVEKNDTGVVSGPVGSTDSNFAMFNGSTGKTIKDNGLALDIDGTLATNSDSNIPSQKAVKTYADTKVPQTRTVNGHALTADVTVTKADVGLGNVTNDAQLKAADLDTDGTLAANSDTKIASQKATKTYADTKVPQTRTINGYDLTANRTLTKSDIGLSAVTNDAQVKASQLVRGTFTNASLSAGILTVTHNLALTAPYTLIVSIFDNNGKEIIADDVTGAANSVDIDLSSFAPLTGTWGYLILG